MKVTFRIPGAVPLAAMLPRSEVSGNTVSYAGRDFQEALRAYLSAITLAASVAVTKR